MSLDPSSAFTFSPLNINTPPSFDLRKAQCFPGVPLSDQKANGSCVLHAVNAGLVCAHRRAGKTPEEIERIPAEKVFEQIFENESFSDKERGVSFESALRALICQHKLIRSAKRLRVDLENFKRCILNGHAVLLGYQVSKSMDEWQYDRDLMTQSNNCLPTFDPSERVIGTHAVLCMGWDDERQALLIRNSWGHEWGSAGHGWFPYDSIVSGAIKDAFVMIG